MPKTTMKTNFELAIPVLASLSLALITGCKTSTPKSLNTTQISCKIPNITPLPETKPSQEKGGLEITIVPATYKAVRSDKLVITPAAPTIGEQLFGPTAAQRAQLTFVQETVVPQLKTQPERLQFAIRINNKLSRVFRGQGAVVQLNVAGKLMPINRSDYAEFVDCIVPPRNESELKVYGPAIDTIPEKATIGIFLYDVVTATDTAGNVTEKQNYEWYFTYETKLAQDSGETKARRGWANTAALMLLRTQKTQDETTRSIIQIPASGQ